MDAEGMRCLVTGAASGIGDATARMLIKSGASVVSLDRHPVTAEVDQHVPVDLADPRSIDAALESIDGSFDALINIAGIPGTAPADLVMKVNFLGMRHLTESMLTRLNRGGSIVVVSSTAGFQWPRRLDALRELIATDSFEDGLAWIHEFPLEGNAYNFSKEAATVYTLAMGGGVRDLAELRINAVLPGPVETPILVDFEETMGKDTLDGVKAFLGRHASPGDIAPAIVFLASRDSRWINGSTIVVDGGITGALQAGLVPTPDF